MSSRRPGAREEPAVLGEELVDPILARLAAVEPVLEQAVEVADHLAVGVELLGRRALDRLGQAVDEAVERLLAELLGQRVEPVARGRLHEVVLLEPADPAADIARQVVELVDPAGGGVAEHRSQGGVRGRRLAGRRAVGRGGGLVEPALDPGPLLGDDLVELLADVGEDVAQLIALLELLAPTAESLAELVQAGQVGPGRVGRPPAALHQAAKRLGEVAFGHDVVRERVDDLVGVEGRNRLGAVPASVAGGTGEERVARGGARGGGLEVAWIRGVARGHRPAQVWAGVWADSRRCRRFGAGPCPSTPDCGLTSHDPAPSPAREADPARIVGSQPTPGGIGALAFIAGRPCRLPSDPC